MRVGAEMYGYTVTQWLFFFYFYCFVGWCFESSYVSAKKRRWTNRGFMRGPFLPLYGSGAIMMLVVSMPFQDNLLLVYIAGCVGATALEYVTGVVMEKLFQVRYWDYSHVKFNFQGHICLGSSLAWGVLTILMTEFVHRPVEELVLSIPGAVLTLSTWILTAGIAADFALSFKAALDLRDVLAGMERVKEELTNIQRRLDVILTAASQDWTSYREGAAESFHARREEITESVSSRVEDLKTAIEEKLEWMRSLMQSGNGECSEDVKEEVLDLKGRYTHNVAERRRLGALRDFFQRDLIRSNPTMRSERYGEALEELKEESMRKEGEE